MKKILAVALALVIFLASGPMLAVATGRANIEGDWRNASRDSASIAPDPASHDGAVVQIYAARAFSWRGAFGVHSWIAVKDRGALTYETFEVIGWRSRWGRSVVSNSTRPPDGRWYGAEPELLLDIRGERAERLLEPIRKAVQEYPFPNRYEVWPGPNSNTFVAHVIREVPGLELELPVTAIGKDYLPGRIVARSLSDTGYQFSLKGLAGVTLARDEGIEFNLLGLSFGLDFANPAIKLPGLGRLGI